MFFPEYEESENHPEFQHLEVPPWRKSKVPDSRELAWPSAESRSAPVEHDRLHRTSAKLLDCEGQDKNKTILQSRLNETKTRALYKPQK